MVQVSGTEMHENTIMLISKWKRDDIEWRPLLGDTTHAQLRPEVVAGY